MHKEKSKSYSILFLIYITLIDKYQGLLFYWLFGLPAIIDHTTNTDLRVNYSESIMELNSFQDFGIRLWIIGSWAKTKDRRSRYIALVRLDNRYRYV